MQNIFDKYLQSISKKFRLEQTSEMGYRTEFEILLNELFGSVKSFSGVDHDAKAFKGNKPDFAIRKNNIQILYIEVKDIGVPLEKIEKSDQMSRYFGYANLILSDYLEFRFYRNGFRYQGPIKIAEYDINTRSITPKPENYELLNQTILDFAQSHKEPIRSGEHLAKIMGGKAQRIRENIRQFISKDEEQNNEINRVYKTIKKLIVHDLDYESFADMYAQTLVYGLFVARYHDDTPESFSRREARELIPKSNPFLRHFFDHITGINFDKRLEHIVNELCEVFTHANVQLLMKQYFQDDLWGNTHEGPDPVIHFYEDFLKEYDADLRKKLGAFYTPLPVVRFIIRCVDHLLAKDFKLPKGLADTSKIDKNIHRVQILDPAVGTGTFLSTTIRTIYNKIVSLNQKGTWPSYVHHELLPRLHGFELMMAPYTIAHLKLSMELKETGFKYFNLNKRLGIYLTNTLEENEIQTELFPNIGLAESIAEESKEATLIKNQTPIMVIIGNPPYFGESNNAAYSGNNVYKFEPTGGKLRERNPKWLNDDYVKFIRFAESMIEKTREGIVAMITAHGYLSNPTFRGMRWHLMQTFDEIYLIDLHGNTNKEEKTSTGGIDKNVFDIKQGVAIFIGVKKKKSNSNTCKIFRTDLMGSRQSKFEFLDAKSLNSIKWRTVLPTQPNYEWVLRDNKYKKVYDDGFSINEIFNLSSVGVVTARDELTIHTKKTEIEKVIQDFQIEDESTLRTKYKLNKDARDWKVSLAKKDVIEDFNEKKITTISYRPFDIRWTYYTGRSRGFHCMPRNGVMKHLLNDNIALIILRQVKAGDTFQHVFVSNSIVESTYISNKTSEINYVHPLYVYSSDGSKVPNLNTEIVIELEKIVGTTRPEDILDYIYAVLHSPTYREKYKEFLKIDFPRVQYPKDQKIFKELVKLGRELRLIHLLESSSVNNFITTFLVTEGNEEVEKIKYENGKVWINKYQYFGNVPAIAWNFYIGGYQPAQKWLKVRRGSKLTTADLDHYQKIIVALTETDRIMKKIDQVFTD